MTIDHRQQLLTIYQAALQAVNGQQAVERYLRTHPISSPVYAVAVGKAAASMMRGAFSVLGQLLNDALVITKHGHCEQDLPVNCLEAAHPVPDDSSLAAGEVLLAFVQRVPADATLLFLVSGGASALVEQLPQGVSLADLRRVNEYLLGAGWDIQRMNRIRKRLSLMKGGRLLAHVKAQQVFNLMISDVPGDRPETIGSGLAVPEPSLRDEEISACPDWLQTLLQRAQTDAPQKLSRVHVQHDIIASNQQARAAAAHQAEQLGYRIFRHKEIFAGDARTLGQEFAETLLASPSGLHIWGGESTVVLPPSPGIGGRNQHMALAAAQCLAGEDNVFFLAAGTDGSDGPTAEAGALVDGKTIYRGLLQGLDVDEALVSADAGTFLAESGDLIHTGPTGTNVMDLVLALKVEPNAHG